MTFEQRREYYLKGIYPVEVVSESEDGYVEVRAKSTFLHTSSYSDGKRQVRVGVTQKRWIRPGDVLQVPSTLVWSKKRSSKVQSSKSAMQSSSATHDGVFRKRHNRSHFENCNKCHKPFVEGDKIHVQNNGGKLRAYHQKCWDRMFI